MSEQVPNVPAQPVVALDSSVLIGMLQEMKDQRADHHQEMQLLRQQMLDNEAARTLATQQQADMLRDQATQHAADLSAAQLKNSQDIAALAAAIQSTGSNQGLPPETVVPKNYPVISDFKLVRNEQADDRMTYFTFRNSLQHRFELHALFRSAVVRVDLAKKKLTEAAIDAELKLIKQAFDECLSRRPPADDAVPPPAESISKYVVEAHGSCHR